MRYYAAGLTPPDDVTLMYTDDNWGNVQRLPSEEERKRSGGIGVSPLLFRNVRGLTQLLTPLFRCITTLRTWAVPKATSGKIAIIWQVIPVSEPFSPLQLD